MPSRRISRCCFILLFLAAACCSSLVAGDTTVVDSGKTVDSLLNRLTAGGASQSAMHAKKRPWVAVGLSAVLPGAGQIYNEAYWKPPIIWGLIGYWIYEWNQNNTKYWDYRGQYAQSIDINSTTGNQQLLKLRDFYRDERDKFAWYIGAFYFLNLVDAYVGANLFDFDVGPSLGAVGQGYPSVNATIRVRF